MKIYVCDKLVGLVSRCGGEGIRGGRIGLDGMNEVCVCVDGWGCSVCQ